MSTLNEYRLKEIINCILAQICNTTEMNKETYVSWLKTEVGISEKEMAELNKDGFLPMPFDYEKEV